MIRSFLSKFSSPRRKASEPTQLISQNVEFFNAQWWVENEHFYPKELRDLTEQFLNGHDLDLTSKYWLHLMLKNYKMLNENGFERFGTTVSRNYFTWTEFNQSQISRLVEREIDENIEFKPFKKHEGFTEEESYKHNLLIFLAYEATKSLPFVRSALEKVSDKGFVFGNAPFIVHDDFTLTLDKLSSIAEVLVFEKIFNDSTLICEIGGGSGRTSDAVLQLFPETKLIYCDIPPASYIAFKRFKVVFPNKVIIIVSDATEFEVLLANQGSWDILMISPALLDVIPKKYVDLFLAIDCLHEFSNENRAKIAGIVADVADFFYTKNWTDTIIPFDEIPLSSNHLSGYYFPENWEILHNQNCLFPGNFTEILFKIPANESL
jgi:putative sugar O-methyltransferase